MLGAVALLVAAGLGSVGAASAATAGGEPAPTSDKPTSDSQSVAEQVEAAQAAMRLENDQKIALSGSAEGSGMSAEEARMQVEQAPYMTLADAVETRFGSSAQWAGAVPDKDNHAVLVYWVGDPGAELTSFAEENSGNGIAVKVVAARDGLSAVIAAANSIGGRNASDALGLNGIAVANDGSGLTVRADSLATGSDVLTMTADTHLMQLLQEVSTEFGVTIAVAPPGGTTDSAAKPGDALLLGQMDAPFPADAP